MKKILAVTFIFALMALSAFAEPVKHEQCYTISELTELDKEDVAGGKGTLHGEFAFVRDNARDEDAIKEIGFMTLNHGAFIGLHEHKDNEDAYLILSGTGLFTDGEGNAWIVKPGDMTIARPGQWHGLANLYADELVFLDIIAKNPAADLEALKANPTPQYFPAEKLFDKNVEHAGGTGEGTLYGKFAFRREQATEAQAIKEIGLMTLKPGDSIGLHKHDANEDTYIILAGTGTFTDGEGNEFIVGPQSVTIAVAGESHALKNTGTEDLVFIDLIAQNHALKK
ncbi:MAG: cupin domain-containing protein [Synergistaceae bacterium]|nr:cupin domain-containing protein [Synergistaceae bacterium]MBQ4400849.1 cupin domain-containing protein [Synergistaceae bacterium]MBQ6115112.1 cupin domain-containing protein [Synergistaceae bacterium]MBQ6418448.1 cupin domain-containing protein [Synergistaceae bacterium]MBQ6664861.1 cupin domain-containing protein [Synergistaceae bacterium]